MFKTNNVDSVRSKLIKSGLVLGVIFLVNFLGFFLIELNGAQLELGAIGLGVAVMVGSSLIAIVLTPFLIKDHWFGRLFYSLVLFLLSFFTNAFSTHFGILFADFVSR